MSQKKVSLPLLLGRIIGYFRAETRVSQREFSSNVGMGSGTLSWIEAGRSNAYASQIFAIERGLMKEGVLDRHGRIFETLDAALAVLAERNLEVSNDRVKTLTDYQELAIVDRLAGYVVQRSLDAIGAGKALMVGEEDATERYVPGGVVKKRGRRPVPRK